LREAILFTPDYLRIIPYKVYMKWGLRQRLKFQKEGFAPKTPAIRIQDKIYSLQEDPWKEEKNNCLLQKRIMISKDDDGEFTPSFMDDRDLKKERVGSDLRRSYRQNQIGVYDLSKNKFSKFSKLIVSIFVIIMVVGLIVAAIAIIGKISTDQAAAIQGGLQNSGFLNNFTSKVLGG